MRNKKGFTLIELLVVISVISLLSSIILAALNTARDSAADSAIKSNLATVRTQANLYSDINNGVFTIFSVGANACSSNQFNVANSFFGTGSAGDPTIRSAIIAAGNSSNGGGLARASCQVLIGAVAGSWAVSVPLRSDPLKSWCVDSAGDYKEVTPAGSDRGLNSSGCK